MHFTDMLLMLDGKDDADAAQLIAAIRAYGIKPLARAAGISQPTMQLWVSGINKIQFELAQRAAMLVGFRFDLFTDPISGEVVIDVLRLPAAAEPTGQQQDSESAKAKPGVRRPRH